MVKSNLYSGLDEELVKQVKGEFIASFKLRERMIEVLERKVDTLHKNMRDDDAFSCSNWPYRQASMLGEIKAHKKLISLLQN